MKSDLPPSAGTLLLSFCSLASLIGYQYEKFLYIAVPVQILGLRNFQLMDLCGGHLYKRNS